MRLASHSSLISIRTALTRCRLAALLGKMPTTRGRRLISLFSRSTSFVVWINRRWVEGKEKIVKPSGRLFSIQLARRETTILDEAVYSGMFADDLVIG